MLEAHAPAFRHAAGLDAEMRAVFEHQPAAARTMDPMRAELTPVAARRGGFVEAGAGALVPQ